MLLACMFVCHSFHLFRHTLYTALFSSTIKSINFPIPLHLPQHLSVAIIVLTDDFIECLPFLYDFPAIYFFALFLQTFSTRHLNFCIYLLEVVFFFSFFTHFLFFFFFFFSVILFPCFAWSLFICFVFILFNRIFTFIFGGIGWIYKFFDFRISYFSFFFFFFLKANFSCLVYYSIKEALLFRKLLPLFISFYSFYLCNVCKRKRKRLRERGKERERERWMNRKIFSSTDIWLYIHVYVTEST